MVRTGKQSLEKSQATQPFSEKQEVQPTSPGTQTWAILAQWRARVCLVYENANQCCWLRLDLGA